MILGQRQGQNMVESGSVAAMAVGMVLILAGVAKGKSRVRW